jgi:plastocyanin
LIVRDPMHFVANQGTSSGVGCKPQSVLRALRLTVLFTVLASAPCLAEDANNAGVGPVATVSMDHNTFIPGEITVVPGTSVTWVNKEAMPHTVVRTKGSDRRPSPRTPASLSLLRPRATMTICARSTRT